MKQTNFLLINMSKGRLYAGLLNVLKELEKYKIDDNGEVILRRVADKHETKLPINKNRRSSIRRK